MIVQIGSESTVDIDYYEEEINRGIGTPNGDFMALDGGGPIVTAINKARLQGRVALLDSGCGTGLGLIELKNQITFRAPLEEGAIHAVGVSLTDFTSRFVGEQQKRNHLSDGYIDYRLGNLATIALEPEHFDVAYSYQVLLHNEDPTLIIKNILPSLSKGGVYYFEAPLDIVDTIEAYTDSLDPSKWQVQSQSLTVEFIGRKATRMMYKVGRNDTSDQPN